MKGECKANYYGDLCQYNVSSAICTQDDVNSTICARWKREGLCKFAYTKDKIPVPVYCPKTCEICKNLVPPCEDENPASCPEWLDRGLCPLLKARSPNLCKKSCKLC